VGSLLFSSSFVLLEIESSHQAFHTFLQALVSGEQIKKVYRMEELIKENTLLKPLAPFLEVKCEICGNTIEDWTENNVKLAREGYGWGHNQCWKSELGQFILFGRVLKKANEEQNKPETAKNNNVETRKLTG